MNMITSTMMPPLATPKAPPNNLSTSFKPVIVSNFDIVFVIKVPNIITMTKRMANAVTYLTLSLSIRFTSQLASASLYTLAMTKAAIQLTKEKTSLIKPRQSPNRLDMPVTTRIAASTSFIIGNDTVSAWVLGSKPYHFVGDNHARQLKLPL